jgi:NAD(P)-dependent dehydrogenase (short-subunit alcohol dehydrogenase family)
MKLILIVGGGGGLGNALVKTLLDQDFRVVVTGRTKPADERVEKFYLNDAVSVDWRSLYVTIEQDAAAPLDAVIFVAGTGVFGKTVMVPIEGARQTFELNYWACTTAARAAAEYWDNKGRAGRFVAILSLVARRAVPFEAYYSASKAATARFLECLQLEYGPKGIEFVCAFPGLLRTPFRRHEDWYGIKPVFDHQGADVQKTARAVVGLLKGKRRTRVIGWRERSIDLVDRLMPGLYDRVVLRPRVKQMLKQVIQRRH